MTPKEHVEKLLKDNGQLKAEVNILIALKLDLADENHSLKTVIHNLTMAINNLTKIEPSF